MRCVIPGLIGLLVFGAGCACSGRDEQPPQRLVARQELTNARPTAALGEDCTLGGRAACLTGVCLHHGGGFDRGYTCSSLCAGDEDCPGNGWACGSILPGDPNRFCIPPRTWAPRAVTVRAAPVWDGGVPAIRRSAATASLDGGLTP